MWQVSGAGPGCQKDRVYEAMIYQCERSVVQVLVARIDTRVVIYEGMTPQCGRSVALGLGCQS